MSSRSLILLLACALPAYGQHLIPQKTFDAIAKEYSGEAAQEFDRQIVQYHRIQSSPMMTEVAEKVVLEKLHAWGIESKIEQFPSDGKISYQKTYITPMGWDMRGGELWVESVAGDSAFVPIRLCRYQDVPMCVSTYSKGGDWSGELVEVGAGTSDKDYVGKDVRGKVALAYGYAANVVRAAGIKRGAVGVVIYPPPGDVPDHPDMVRYNGTWATADELPQTVGGFQISQNQYTQLRGLMEKGAVRMHGKIDAILGPGQLTLVHAWIRGTKNPETEILITGHLDHPKWSANDNASGSAAMLEMVRTLHSLIAAGKLTPPASTIHFMWVPEYHGTIAYLTKHPEIRACAAWDDPRNKEPYRAGHPCVIANLNLDMVGEDTEKTNSRFYITRTPDSVPGTLNAFLSDVLEQTREGSLYAPTGTRHIWHAQMYGPQQGSDHDLFLSIGVPAAMFGHDPDWTHHSSEDTPDKTDASEFLRVGVLADAAAYAMASGSADDEQRVARIMTGDMIADYAHRIAAIFVEPNSDSAKKRLLADENVMASLLKQQQSYASGLVGKGIFEIAQTATTGDASSGSRPRRLSLTPYNHQVQLSEQLSGADKKWWDEQETKFAYDAPDGGLPLNPPFAQITFEAMNFMDGKRTTSEIADRLSVEFNQDFDQAWVDQLVKALAKVELVNAGN